MWLSKLDLMSVGPLWVLRAQSPVPQVCPVCGAPWVHATAADSSLLAVLSAPISDQAQQTLLQNCLRAAGFNEFNCLTLHDTCPGSSEAAVTAMQKQVAETPFETIVVFGESAAQKINPEFRRGHPHIYQNARLIVTHHPEEMMANPALKAQVWSDLCQAVFANEN